MYLRLVAMDVMPAGPAGKQKTSICTYIRSKRVVNWFTNVTSEWCKFHALIFQSLGLTASSRSTQNLR